MACDAQTLTTDARCLVSGMSELQLLASWALLVCGGGPPPEEGGRITEDGSPRVIEDGGRRIIQSQ